MCGFRLNKTQLWLWRRWRPWLPWHPEVRLEGFCHRRGIVQHSVFDRLCRCYLHEGLWRGHPVSWERRDDGQGFPHLESNGRLSLHDRCWRKRWACVERCMGTSRQQLLNREPFACKAFDNRLKPHRVRHEWRYRDKEPVGYELQHVHHKERNRQMANQQ